MCSFIKLKFHHFSLATIFIALLLDIRAINCDKHNPNSVRINKCCESFEILVDGVCTHVNKTNTGLWSPIFTDYNGRANVQVPDFWFAIGIPQCGNRQIFTINHDPTSRDRLALLPDGKLRHYISHPDADDAFDTDDGSKPNTLWDYAQGKYCMDKSISAKGLTPSEHAMVCSPEKDSHWTDTEFILRKIVHPVFHMISIIILLFVAVIYFILPSLRDLVGNILTTMTCCLIINHGANILRIFTEFRNHINFLIIDMVAHISMIAVFFWLSSLGYYIWKTFRSRNVFLKFTDGTKYCWYSFYAWGSTASMSSLGVFAHFFLDITAPKKIFLFEEEPETVGILALSIFFITNAMTIAANVYFFISTRNYLNSRMNASYGRIHYKLKSNFIMFSLLLCMLTITWILSIFTWFESEGMFYMNLTISAIQAPLVLYICVLRQEHITYLLKKSCCSKQPLSAADWGDEMTYINTANR